MTHHPNSVRIVKYSSGQEGLGTAARATAVDQAAGIVRYVASDGLEDRSFDIVDQTTWNLAEWKAAGSPICVNHDVNRIVGRGVKAEVQGGRLVIDVQFDLQSELAETREVGRQALKGIGRQSGSVGFFPGKWISRADLPRTHPAFREPDKGDGAWGSRARVLAGTWMTDNVLAEFSIATIPANPRATVHANGTVGDVQKWLEGGVTAGHHHNDWPPESDESRCQRVLDEIARLDRERAANEYIEAALPHLQDLLKTMQAQNKRYLS